MTKSMICVSGVNTFMLLLLLLLLNHILKIKVIHIRSCCIFTATTPIRYYNSMSFFVILKSVHKLRKLLIIRYVTQLLTKWGFFEYQIFSSYFCWFLCLLDSSYSNRWPWHQWVGQFPDQSYLVWGGLIGYRLCGTCRLWSGIDNPGVALCLSCPPPCQFTTWIY